jgi:hypothetical protein
MPVDTSPASSPAVARRTRDGCQTCKKRRKRCDEQRPSCGGCARLGLGCIYGINVRWGTTRESFELSTMPQTGIGSASSPNDALNGMLEDIHITPGLHRLIDATLDREGRNILLRCKIASSTPHDLTLTLRSPSVWLSPPRQRLRFKRRLVDYALPNV